MSLTEITDKSLLVFGLKVTYLGSVEGGFEGATKIHGILYDVDGTFKVIDGNVFVQSINATGYPSDTVTSLTDDEVDFEELAECIQMRLPEDNDRSDEYFERAGDR